MKPTNLPKDWIVVTSKSHPNRVYYFNVKTNKASWEVPIDEPESGTTSKKRKKNADSDNAEHRPTTPELEVPKKAKATERPMLRAKRSINPADRKDTPKQSSSGAASNETPQMRQLREKMLERQAKGNASRRSKVIAPPIVPEEEKVEKPEGKPPSTSEDAAQKAQNLTPQMRVLLEKMKERKAKGAASKSPAKSEDLRIAPQVTPLRRPRARSIASADSPVTNLSIKTRRSSRRTINASTVISSSPKQSNIAEYASEDEVSSTISEIIPGQRTPIRKSPKASPKSPKKVEKNLVQLKRVSPTSVKQKVPRLGRSALLKKNLAEERLLNLRKSLGDENSAVENSQSSSPSPSPKLPENARILLHDVSMNYSKEKPPSIYKNAEVRMNFLRERLHMKSIHEKRMHENATEATTSMWEVETDCNVANALNNTDTFCEEMEWEHIEDDKIMQEIEVVRSHISAMDEDTKPQEVPQNNLDLPDGPAPPNKKSLYIVVDTNVFLSNIGAIEEARDVVFRTHGRPLIVVPWTVIRELDFIKDDKSMTRPECLRAKARQAVRFLHQHFSARHPRVLGQTPMDVANNRHKYEVECPDDEILQTCLQIRMSNNPVVLLSYDKNLCNKAMIHDIATLGRHDPLEKVDYLHASDARNESFLAQHLRGEEQDTNVVPIFVKELRIAEEILNQAKEVLTSFLSVIVAKEMQNLYNEHWEKYTIIRPPWSVFSVLKCAIKHWIAAVSESFTRGAEPLLKELLDGMNRMPDSGRKLSDVSHILEMIYDLVQCVKVDKYTNITVRSGRAIAELRAQCVNATQKLNDEKLQDAIGLQRNEEEARANVAFQQFEEVYAFARDMCGLASEAIGMPCSFPFKKFNPLPTIENIKAMQPDVAANLNRLLQVLSTALEELNGLHADHRAVLALYNALYTFMPDQKGQLPREFSPLDVYWCLKIKEKLLRSGLGQLQELSSHFCRMASFRCT